ncbi:hypothetical protein GDO78_017244 [Eleutherodactylus coqui]|uniref:Uncharacterized protein n=1 Tax=Eleutherodactylus coqui TaxID=57060 RepID=A0A8J6BF53_ELECQ|nr:hypothetical protein GDO78_017244 [Eleutherodactylus coqui]
MTSGISHTTSQRLCWSSTERRRASFFTRTTSRTANTFPGCLLLG